MVYCYAELLAVAETVASIHCVYPGRDGQAKLAWVTGGETVTHLTMRTNRAELN